MKLNDGDIDRLTQAITDAEAKSSGEIRLVIVGSCTVKAQIASIVLSALMGSACAYGWWIWEWGHPSPIELCMAGLGPALIAFALAEIVLRRPAARARLVEERAKSEFVRQGVAATRDKTGILILVSIGDRRVQLLADEGINAKVPPSMWADEVAKIVDGIKSKRVADRLCEAIADVGAELAKHFPRRPDDTNELPNRPAIS